MFLQHKPIPSYCRRRLPTNLKGGRGGRLTSEVVEDAEDEDVDDLHEDQQDDDPLELAALPVVHDVLEQLQVLLDDGCSFKDVPVPVLEVEGLLQGDVEPVQGLVFPGDVRRIEDVQVFGDLVLDLQDVPDEALQAPAGEGQLAGGFERVDVDRGLAEQVVGDLQVLVQPPIGTC